MADRFSSKLKGTTVRDLRTLALAALMGVVIAPLSAQAATTVGTATPAVGNCFPFGCNAATSSTGLDIDYEQIYSASAFSGVTTFDTLTFKDSGLNFLSFLPPGTPASPDLLAGDYDITVFTTTAPLDSGYPVLPQANESTFFLGHLDASADYSGFAIGGSTYTYDPSEGNLVVEVKAYDQAVTPNSGANGYLAVDESGLMTTRAYEQSAALGPKSDSQGLVTSFSVGPLAAVPEPATWLFMIAGVGGIGLTLRNGRRSGAALFEGALSS